MEQIKGYDYGKVGISPVTMDELALLKKTVLFTEEDEKFLKLAGEVLKDQVSEILDLWYGYVGGNEHLLYYFSKEGTPNTDYLNAVRARFEQWVLDICNKPYDQTWLNYQQEIAIRHHSIKKNKTDGVDSVPIINYRYMVAFIFPITATIKGFLAKNGLDTDTVEAMHAAWFKAITMTAILWTYPYINKGEF